MTFTKMLQSAPIIVMDGAMGTELMRRGIRPGGAVNLESPGLVARIHREYVQAGAKLLLTNTLTANRVTTAGRIDGAALASINAAGVRLAREGAGPDCVVLGDIGSTGRFADRSDRALRDDLADAFAEQARVLAGEGADGFMIETMCHIEEALIALGSCQRVSDLPVVVSFALKTAAEGGRTIAGDPAMHCARRIEAEGAVAVGFNCGEVAPDEMAGIVKALAAAAIKLPLLAKPNAGIPRFCEGRLVYGLSEPDFARGGADCHRAGATLVGGCCGTTPGHIRALTDHLKN